MSYGPRAVLAEFETIDQVMASAGAWRAARYPGVIDVVAAARTVLVSHDGTFDPGQLTAAPTGVGAPSGPLVEVPVRYDGEDLAEVARSVAMSPQDVIAMHSAAVYTVAFCGFMPGFSYLVGLDRRLHLPRRTTPRQRVPAGSVAIAGEFTGVYPRPSPGGWHLLGTTDLAMWQEERNPPATLPPGARVRFVAR